MVALNPVSVLVRDRREDGDTEGRPCEGGGRDRVMWPRDQERPRPPGAPQTRKDPPWSPWRECSRGLTSPAGFCPQCDSVPAVLGTQFVRRAQTPRQPRGTLEPPFRTSLQMQADTGASAGAGGPILTPAYPGQRPDHPTTHQPCCPGRIQTLPWQVTACSVTHCAWCR